MIYKILRKLGLGPAALNLTKPFIGSACTLPAMEQARAHLQAQNPDAGSSCLWDKTRSGSGIELDIIIPAYNAEKYIAACLDSALGQQTGHSFRLIVIDDGSTDSTGTIIDSYASNPRMLIVHQENRGFSGARNAGLRLSDAEYVSFLDSDDTLPAGAIEALMGCAKEHREGGYCSVSPEGKELSHTGHKAGRLDARKELFGFTAMKVISSELMDGICFPEGYWYEDSIMAQIIYPLCEARGLTAWGVDSCVYNYTINPAGISHTGRKSTKSIDSFYISRSLCKDREKLGLEKDQSYYEYILNMVVLSYRRCENQSEETKKAMFLLWQDFLKKEFDGFDTESKAKRILQQALTGGNYPLYCAACKLI